MSEGHFSAIFEELTAEDGERHLPFRYPAERGPRRRRAAPAVSLADTTAAPSARRRLAPGRGCPDRPREDIGDGVVADCAGQRCQPAAAARLRSRPAGGRGSGDTVREASALEHARRDGGEAGARCRCRAPNLHAARRIRRQSDLAGRSLEARHRGRDHRHGRLPAAVRRLRRIKGNAPVP